MIRIERIERFTPHFTYLRLFTCQLTASSFYEFLDVQERLEPDDSSCGFRCLVTEIKNVTCRKLTYTVKIDQRLLFTQDTGQDTLFLKLQ